MITLSKLISAGNRKPQLARTTKLASYIVRSNLQFDCGGRVEREECMKTINLDDVNVVEILDRVLDNGIVVDPSARVFLIGHDLHGIEGRVVVESVSTYL